MNTTTTDAPDDLLIDYLVNVTDVTDDAVADYVVGGEPV